MAEYNLEEVWIYSRYGFDTNYNDEAADNEESEECDKAAEHNGVTELQICLQETGIRIVSLKKALAEGILPKENAIIVTDCPEIAEYFAKNNLPVLGILTRQNENAPFAGVRYLSEGWDDITPVYLERIYRRYCSLPWQILETERCILRETTEADVDAFYRIYAEPSVTAFMENLFSDREEELRYTADYREKVYALYGFGIWTIILKATGEVIGRAGLDMRRGFTEPELGFVIGVPWQRQGLAKEVCSAILRYGEEELGFTKVQALTEQENTASLALLKKLGFVLDGKYEEMGKEYLRYIYGY
ncbi:MAG: GNAT family N-acetyltransferase [Lachnospiraceae bacterium]|nr:GNAT family N-acetyltransferase [Lachnospiraceae bacterium]